MGKIMYAQNGVQYFKGVGSDSMPRFSRQASIFFFDWDATVARESDVHNLEEVVYPLFHRANGLWTIEAVRKALNVPFDLLYQPIATCHAMTLAGEAPCQRHELLEKLVKTFLSLYQRVETSVKPHDGAYEAITRLRQLHPDSYFVIVTQCPWYLGLGRTATTGMTTLFDGIVGVRQERPSFLSEYVDEVEFVDSWIAAEMAKLDLSHYRVIAGVPENLAKPNPLHGLVALGANPWPTNTVFAFDDKPRRMAGVAAQFSKYCPSVYVHAKVSTWEEATPEYRVDGRYMRMDQLPWLVALLQSKIDIGPVLEYEMPELMCA
jgi:hypothetical protein